MEDINLFHEARKITHFTISDSELTTTANKSVSKTICQIVKGLQFMVKCFPNGNRPETAGYVSIIFRVNTPARLTLLAALEGSSISMNQTVSMTDDQCGFEKFASHQQVRDHFKDNKATFYVGVFVDVVLCRSRFKHNIFETTDEIPFDCEFVVGDKSFPAHKHLLALISPSLYANFTHNTIEAKTGKIIITDFDDQIVAASIDFFYGRYIRDTSIEILIGMCRFCDKYNIKSSKLKRVPLNNINITSFCIVVHYAYDCCDEDVFHKCAIFFWTYEDTIKSQFAFKRLPIKLIVRLLEKAHSLISLYRVLHYAYTNDMQFINDRHDPLLTITVENFCETAGYAWKCDRFDLQVKCAKFLSNDEHRAIITISEKFIALEKDTVSLILQASKDVINK